MSEALRRKLTTIVATDVAEFARLVDEDEETTLQALHDCRRTIFNPLIEKHGGRLANTAGDSMLIEFSSTIEAVRFAIEVQGRLAQYNAKLAAERQIWLRIGINVGDVISEGRDLLGDGVNIAARLERIADSGGIHVSRAVRDQVRDHIRLEFEDLGKISVRHIARPVHVFKIAGMETVPGKTRAVRASRNTLLLGLGLLAILASLSHWLGGQADYEPADPENLAYQLPAKPSIAVLPFSNLSGDPDQDFLAISFSEDVLTSLSELSGLFVISGSTTSKLRGTEYTPKRVAEELGVRYVLRGNLQREENRLRISSQLVDTFDGQIIWSDRYDREMTDLFLLKDEITLEIVANIGAQLELGERDKISSRETGSPVSYTHLTLPTIQHWCRSRWSPYH